jgi:hypothetical protein
MPGFMQFLTGISLLIGLTWFNVFATTKDGPSNTSPLYMAALAWHPLVCNGPSALYPLQRFA